MSFKSALGSHRVKEEAVIRVEDIVVNNIPVFGTDGKMKDSGVPISGISSGSITINGSSGTNFTIATGSATTAGNGLSMNGSSVELGGDLDTNTTINANGHEFRINNTSDLSIGEAFKIVSEATLLSDPYTTNNQIYLDGYSGFIKIKSSTTSTNFINVSTDYLTDDRYIQFQDTSGTVALLENVGVIATTYSNLVSLKNSSSFTVNQLYKITHQTKHLIPNTSDINTGSSEDLILRAISPSKFHVEVYSVNYPNDIIHFNFNDILCEDASTPREGKITFRKDTIRNITTHYDFRNVKTRRWPSDDILYPSSLPISVSAGTNGSNYVDYYTIENSQNPIHSNNIYIGKSTTQAYSNNLLLTQWNDLNNIHLSDDCNNNFIGEACSNNWFGFECSNNVLHGANINNFFMSNCDSNILEWGCVGNKFGDNCYHNIIIDIPTSSGNYRNNELGNNCQNNIIRGNDNKLEASCKFIVMNGICNGSYFCSGIENKTYGYLSNCKILVATTEVKTFSNSLYNSVIDMIDSNSVYYYRVVDTSGVITTQAFN